MTINTIIYKKNDVSQALVYCALHVSASGYSAILKGCYKIL